MRSAPKYQNLENPASDPGIWMLDPAVEFLNHGSFGSCPRQVLDFQRELRERLEREPVQFMVRELEGLMGEAREALGSFVGAHPEDLVFVPNATTAVNSVLRSLPLRRGDELLVTDHEYNACRNALDFAAHRAGARVVVVPIPFPLAGESVICEAVLERVTGRTRLALLDHVTSQTGLIFPMKRLITGLAEHGVDTLVDGAHAPGMVPLNLRELGAAYYTGNCHKWMCAPKGAAFLHVRKDRQTQIRPLTISHGANSPRTDRSRFQLEFGWMGTSDPTACLSVPEALRFMESLLPGGWPDVMQRNRTLALASREILCQALTLEPPCPAGQIASLASIPLPDSTNDKPPLSALYTDPLQEHLRTEFGIEVPIIPWPAPPKRLLRISAQLYNSLPQYQKLAHVLKAVLESH